MYAKGNTPFLLCSCVIRQKQLVGQTASQRVPAEILIAPHVPSVIIVDTQIKPDNDNTKLLFSTYYVLGIMLKNLVLWVGTILMVCFQVSKRRNRHPATWPRSCSKREEEETELRQSGFIAYACSLMPGGVLRAGKNTLASSTVSQPISVTSLAQPLPLLVPCPWDLWDPIIMLPPLHLLLSLNPPLVENPSWCQAWHLVNYVYPNCNINKGCVFLEDH